MSKPIVILISLLALLVIFIGVTYIARFALNKNVEKEVEAFFSGVENSNEIISEKEIEDLPANVQNWLVYSGVIGKEKIAAVHLKQKAEMRLDKDGSWMKVTADQYFRTAEPGFIWDAKIKAGPLVHISGIDKYEDGSGNMLIKPLSLFTAANSKGSETDQGSLLRYLAETMWFPTAALSEYLTWEEIDEYRAKVTMDYEGVTAFGIFTFNDKGQVISFEAERYGEFDGEYRMETWYIPVRDYKEFEGIKIPSKGDVTWRLDEGDFNWFNFEVIDVEYNKLGEY